MFQKEAASAVNALRAKEEMPEAMGAQARTLLLEIVAILHVMSK